MTKHRKSILNYVSEETAIGLITKLRSKGFGTTAICEILHCGNDRIYDLCGYQSKELTSRNISTGRKRAYSARKASFVVND